MYVKFTINIATDKLNLSSHLEKIEKNTYGNMNLFVACIEKI